MAKGNRELLKKVISVLLCMLRFNINFEERLMSSGQTVKNVLACKSDLDQSEASHCKSTQVYPSPGQPNAQVGARFQLASMSGQAKSMKQLGVMGATTPSTTRNT